MCRTYSGDDRRRFQRLKINLSVFYKVEGPWYARDYFGDGEIEASTLDIGEEGMALLSPKSIPIWTVLLIRVYLFRTNANGLVSFFDPLEMTAEVKSSLPAEEGRYRLGVQFKGIGLQDKNKIGNLVSCVK